MNSFTFIYIIGVFIILNLFQGFTNISLENQLIYSSILILLLGIPHGAIDHVLFFKKRKMSQLKFYSIYLGLSFLFVILWHILPVTSLILFLLISAFHFGESQFADIFFKKSLRNIFYFFWGLCLLSTLMYYNVNELYDITSYFDDTIVLDKIYNKDKIGIFFYITNVVTIISIITLTYFKKINNDRLFSELFLLFLIHATFYLFPFIIGFTLYFVALHSIKVMNDEFKFLKNENNNFSIKSFLRLLAPYSILSIVGTSFLLTLSYYNLIPYSIPFLAIIIISVITLPHAIVMNIFYNE